jgi:signal transduction histidine kinase
MGTQDRLVDWIVVTLRWLVILGLAIAIAMGGEYSLVISLTFLVAAGVNIGTSLLLIFDRQLPFQHYASVAVDLVLACLLFYQSGTTQGGAGWAIVLPLMSASIFFGLPGGGIVAILGLLFVGVLTILSVDIVSALFFLVSLVPLCLLVVLVFGSLSSRIAGYTLAGRKAKPSGGQGESRHTPDGPTAIFKLVSLLSATLNYQKVLETALDLSAEAIAGGDEKAPRMVSAVLLYSENESGNPELRVGSSRRFTQADIRISLPGTDGLLGKVIDGGEARLIREIPKDPELGRIVALRACLSAYCIPLATGLDTYGVLLFGHPQPDFFSPERRVILDMIARQVVNAIQNARLYRDLEQEKERMMAIQDEARIKLARDLHDGPTQSIAAIAMQVNYARRLVERDQKAAADELFKVEELARRTTKEIRHMLFTLRPLVLETQGLVKALESMAEKMQETYNQQVSISADPEVVTKLEPTKQEVVFYIIEEAVNNARKHAKAEQIWVRLRPAGKDLVFVEIEDNGVGFDPKAISVNYESRGSLGMVNMRERAELVNGYLKIESVLGKGSLISVLIPLTEDAVERARRGQG